jgi:hypothetical protein
MDYRVFLDGFSYALLERAQNYLAFAQHLAQNPRRRWAPFF